MRIRIRNRMIRILCQDPSIGNCRQVSGRMVRIRLKMRIGSVIRSRIGMMALLPRFYNL